jgi:hypothetical protein
MEVKCPVCYDLYNLNLSKPFTFDECGHSLCQKCIPNLVDNTCPECRVRFNKVNQNYGLLTALEMNADMISDFKEAMSNLNDLQKKYDDYSNLISDNREVNEQIFDKVNTEINYWEKKEIEKVRIETARKVEEIKQNEKILLEEISERKKLLSNECEGFRAKYSLSHFGDYIYMKNMVKVKISNWKNMLYDNSVEIDNSPKNINDEIKHQKDLLEFKSSLAKQVDYHYFCDNSAKINGFKIDLDKLKCYIDIENTFDSNKRKIDKIPLFYIT